MKRGEVYWVAFPGSQGGEIQKTRPAVILSNDAANEALNRLVVVPFSSKTETLYPNEVLVQWANQTSKALTSQITTISKSRTQNKAGKISNTDMKNLESALLRHLGVNF